jgi:two-component system response regulator YesN
MDEDVIARKDRRVARAIRVVLDDLSIRYSRAAVARAANVEPTYFSKLFRDVTGISFREWNMSVRVNAARILLRTTNRQIRAVAAAVGYLDVTTFARAFRKATGMSPREYRVTANAQNAERSTLNAENYSSNADGI